LSDKPPLGKNPFEAEIAAYTSVSTAAPAVSAAPAPRDINSGWFQQQVTAGRRGLAGLHDLPGSMEVRFAPEVAVNKSRKDLLEAVQNSEIRTFGWPIGVTLQNREEYRPRPTQQGIQAEIAIENSALNGRASYDYWALTQQGDFFLLQSLFEDSRGTGSLFFNTRIVRVTEAFLFASNLYRLLGANADTKITVRFIHKGLAGRVLTSSTPNRVVFQNLKTKVDSSETEFTVEVGRIEQGIVECVRNVCAPLFEIFDFAEFGYPIYEDIVRKFMAGTVS
jgi:hypothetical protein